MHRSANQDLPLVMEEVRSALGASATSLTLHPDGRAPVLLFGEAPLVSHGEFAQGLVALLSGYLLGQEPRRHCWFERSTGLVDGCVLVIPVEPVKDHSQLLISAFLKQPSVAQRRTAERAYLDRRPFATGYFRLLQLHRVSARKIATLEQTLDHSAMGVILLDRRGVPIFMNAAARAVVERRDGLTYRNGALLTTDLKDNLRLRLGIERALGQAEDSVAPPNARTSILAVRRAGRTPLILAVVAASYLPEELGDAAATLFIVDPATDTPDLAASTCRLLGMSRVESRLASHLTTGLTLTAAAEAMHIKEETARSYLKSIFSKTGINRQSSLVRMILTHMIRVFGEPSAEIMP